jgi:hypothetical protein
MRQIARPIILAALALTGCGPAIDNPANVPLLGHWQQTTKLTALVINDVWTDRKDAPFPLPEDKTIDRGCTEPMLKSNEQVNDDLFDGNLKACKFAPVTRDGLLTHSDAVCEASEIPGGTVSGKMEYNGEEAKDLFLVKLSATMFFKERSGASVPLRFGVESRWTRLGDCGS